MALAPWHCQQSPTQSVSFPKSPWPSQHPQHPALRKSNVATPGRAWLPVFLQVNGVRLLLARDLGTIWSQQLTATWTDGLSADSR